MIFNTMGILKTIVVLCALLSCCECGRNVTRHKHKKYDYFYYKYLLFHEFKFFVFVLVKIKILLVFGTLWTIALLIGKVFAIVKASEYMKINHEDHHEKLIYSAPPAHNDHSSFGSPYGQVGSPFGASGYASGASVDDYNLHRRQNIPEYRKYKDFYFVEQLKDFVSRLNTTEIVFEEMGITSADCKRKLICEVQYAAKHSSILSFLLNILRDSSFEKYRTDGNIPEMYSCTSTNSNSCKEDIT